MERKKKVRLKRKDDATRNPGKKPKTVNQILPEAAEQTTAPCLQTGCARESTERDTGEKK